MKDRKERWIMAGRIALSFLIGALLTGCGAKKAVTRESYAVSLTDTTKTESESLTIRQTATDTTKTTAKVKGSAVIEFAETGGSVSIDTAGNVSLQGVKTISGSLASNAVKLNAVNQTRGVSQSRISKANGIQSEEQQQTEQTQPAKRQKWYQTVLAKIGGLCCIAALLCALFLYLKRKR